MKKTSKIKVRLHERSYSIFVGHDLEDELRRLGRALPSKRAFVISDISLKAARRKLGAQLRRCGFTVHEIAVMAGEGLKDFKNCFHIYGKLLEAGAHRDSVIFALGGGSVGDAAGFIASTYLRGVAWVGVPTTLLAQVDSAIGGKTAVNHVHGKNLIGTFYQPAAVLCDVDFLATLGQREIISGLGEAIKYGLIYDALFYKYICANWSKAVALDREVMTRIVCRCAEFKAHAVERDEFDLHGVREVLNFGHTMGHALEKATNYKVYQHGEAVLWGMRFALALSQVRGHMTVKVRQSLDSFLAGIEVPPWPRGASIEKLASHLSKDKKVRGGSLHYVLLKNLGKTVSDSGVGMGDLSKAYALLMREGIS